MAKVSLNTLWKIAVLILLGIIAFYGYKIDSNTTTPKYFYVPSPVPAGCSYSGGTVSNSALPQICYQPLKSATNSK